VNARSWIDHITNDTEVRAILPEGLPLDDLLFFGVSIQPGNILIVETLTRSMPVGVPIRWVDRGGEFLSITFRIGLRTANINAQEVDGEQTVRVLLTAGEFSLSASDGACIASPQINAKTFFVEVNLKPMQHSQLLP